MTGSLAKVYNIPMRKLRYCVLTIQTGYDYRLEFTLCDHHSLFVLFNGKVRDATLDIFKDPILS